MKKISIALLISIAFALMSTSAQAQDNKNATSTEQSNAEVFRALSQKPSPDYNWKDYLIKNLKYPQTTADEKKEGMVVIEFIVKADGSIADLKVIKNFELSKAFTDEAIRVVKAAPNWQPGKHNGKVVDAYMTLPINFKLN